MIFYHKVNDNFKNLIIKSNLKKSNTKNKLLYIL